MVVVVVDNVSRDDDVMFMFITSCYLSLVLSVPLTRVGDGGSVGDGLLWLCDGY